MRLENAGYDALNLKPEWVADQFDRAAKLPVLFIATRKMIFWCPCRSKSVAKKRGMRMEPKKIVKLPGARQHI